MTHLVLVRHGESEWNVARRIQGQSGTGLSARGRRQAERTAEVIADVHPDADLISSDLERCRLTAELVGSRLGREPSYDPGLRERDFGAWTGRLATEVAGQDRERWERWRAGEDVIAETGGEDSPTLAARVIAVYRRLAADAGDGTVVCVTHGGPVWHGTRALLELDDGVLGGVANCSITEIRYDGSHATLLSWNQVAHLPRSLRFDDRGDEDR